ncbi:hypothetical protein Zmor_006456 [Zophobas morio]|uniref:Uncharacterized protein n=1 Tax=Zophobas morio TaxID=2755281 RepID=A0AA38ITR2_9CUCU|nr:hypothetical protein Zmor_006456 [Zophobas morio]
MTNLWDEATCEGLQYNFFYIAARELVWKGNEAGSPLVSFFRDEAEKGGELSGQLEYNPVFSKNRQGSSHLLNDSKWLISNKESPDICHVDYLKNFY